MARPRRGQAAGHLLLSLPSSSGADGSDAFSVFPSDPANPADPGRLLACGIDEAGRGCLAGPVVAAAVILPERFDLPGLTDSKALTEARREALVPLITAQATAWRLGFVWPAGPAGIDALNILQATFLAMSKAVRRLPVRPARLLVDGDKTVPERWLPGPYAQEAIVGGDALVPAISAASVLAKTFRDRLMRVLDRRHPGYGLAGHKGYGTKEHREALRRLGPSACHRMTFAGVVEDQCRLPGT